MTCSIAMPRTVLVLLAFALSSPFVLGQTAQKAPSYDLVVQCDRESAVYKVGDTVRFMAKLTLDGKPAENITLDYELWEEWAKRTGRRQLKFLAGAAQVSYEWKKPSGVLLRVDLPREGKKRPKIVMAAAVCEPEKYAPSMPKPDDFDAFWNGKKAALDKDTTPPVMTPVKNLTNAKIETHEIVLNSIGGAKAHGFFAKRKGKGPFPAFIFGHGASVRGINARGVAFYASKGVMAIDIGSHDFPNGKPDEFYKQLQAGKLKRYYHIGRDDRETSYFLRMFCSFYKAARYVTTRPEWDGKRFVMSGGSQGGGQSFATAYLCPEITAIATNVPAMCEHTNREAGRRPGWPSWVSAPRGKANPKQLQASRYFDCVNFARTIRAKALMSVGFIDMKCSPAALYPVFNVLPGEKRIINLPLLGHGSSPQWTKASRAFIYRELGLAE